MIIIDGLPLTFFLPLVVHALAGLTTGVCGVVAFSVPKAPTRHHRWGTRYLWAYTVVFLTASLLSVQHWSTDAYLFGLAVLGYSFALGGYSARRFRQTPWLHRLLGEWWVIAHLVGMIGSYVVLWTAFFVDNGHFFPGLNQLPSLTFWAAPTLIAIPFLVRSIARFAPKPPAPSTLAPAAPPAVRDDTGDALLVRNDDVGTRAGS
ncbi:MAG TPA: hypothetical protein VGR57_12105 [Ktedonobacterales bacterium]|nr:hypothetical protein [Ktedonobacterales bacterium]